MTVEYIKLKVFDIDWVFLEWKFNRVLAFPLFFFWRFIESLKTTIDKMSILKLKSIVTTSAFAPSRMKSACNSNSTNFFPFYLEFRNSGIFKAKNSIFRTFCIHFFLGSKWFFSWLFHLVSNLFGLMKTILAQVNSD